MDTPDRRLTTVKDLSAYLHMRTTTEYCARKHRQLPFKLGGTGDSTSRQLIGDGSNKNACAPGLDGGHFKVGRFYPLSLGRLRFRHSL